MGSPAMVCYSMGSINSLVEKIPLMEKRPMIQHLFEDIKSLRDDLLCKFAGGHGEGRQEQVKVWMKQAREMVYDIEDWIDLKQGAADFSQSDDEKQTDRFKYRIKQARYRCATYELLKQAPTSGAGGPCQVVADCRLYLAEKAIQLVGTKGPKSELLKHMKKEQKGLKVVSIHGMGGLGKTVLAKEIFGDTFVKGFECQAFVSVGRTTSTRTALMEILRQVKSEEDACQYRSSNEIMKELWGFLRTKRYFICIDDIRSIEDSEIIICALPDNNFGSRILVTTRMEDIAISCSRRPSDVSYKMEALGKCHSDKLFLNTVYDPEGKWKDSFEDSSNKIFEVCGGVPLATIMAAGFLGGATAEVPVRLEVLLKTNLLGIHSYSASEVMRNLLDISYGDLPLPMKSCFLYLSAFPGNYYIIKKVRLIQRWVAEGFLPDNHVKSSWETGESYFDELISRRLIQPVFDDSDDQPIGCTVHGVVFDFIESLSSEANFITAGAKLKSGLALCDSVRRVSLAYSDEDNEGDSLTSSTYCLVQQKCVVTSSTYLSRVRTLAFCGDARRIPDLSALKHVRVLDLEDAKGLENKQLRSIGGLYLLRYLALGKTADNVIKLPEDILALELLTTLDLRLTKVRKLQGFRDKKLTSLLSDQLILAVEDKGRMQKLEELSKVLVGPPAGLSAEDMAGFVQELGRLRKLGVRFSHLQCQSETDRQGVKHFLEEVGKSSLLQSLLLDNYPDAMLDLLANNSCSSLRKLELRLCGCLPRVPQEMASLISLTHLHITVESVEAQAVRTLGSLPSLVLLKLYCCTSPRGLAVTKEDGFKCLKVLWCNSQYGGGMGLKFGEKAMPDLRRLWLDLDATGTMLYHDGFDFGIQNLACLAQLHATIDWRNTRLKDQQVEEKEALIRELVSRYPSRPVLELERRRHRPAAKVADGLVIEIHSREQWLMQQRVVDPRKLMVVQFSAWWCPASRRMGPVFSALANKYRDVIFLKADVEDDEIGTIAQQYEIEGVVPTFLFMKEGHEVGRVTGAKNEELEAKLQASAAGGLN